MVVASLNVRAQPHKRPEVLSAADALIRQMRAVPGCSRALLLNDVEDANALTLASEWSNRQSADAYFASRGFQGFLGIRMLLRDEPFLVFDEIRQRAIRMLREPQR
jgi:quinol monooxygenase YgiN